MILRPTPKGNIKGSYVLPEVGELLCFSAWGKSSQGCSKFWGSSGPSAKLRLKAARKQRRSKNRRIGFSQEDP
jgi:hypothetical protein